MHPCPECGLLHGPPAKPVLCSCGHPVEVHHRTDSGRITYCTVWQSVAEEPRKPATQCGCQKAELPA